MGCEDESKSSPDEEVHVLYLYETGKKIYQRRFVGFFRKLKKCSGVPLLMGYLLLPWLQIDGRQAVWFDLPARKFHIFSITFWPQDFMMLAWLLIIAAFALFAVTVVVGRVWCGFSCPQTVWTMMYVGVEHFFEGGRNKRIKLDLAPRNFNKVWRKVGKHAVWLLIAFITGFTFVAYFNPVRQLALDFFSFTVPADALFWTFFFTLMSYMNAGYLREQVCKYMCPYARFQSVMFDADTLLVCYDKARGEARGQRKRDSDYRARGLGDCVDCGLCVQVCPVGIDIRDGLQSDCISCGLCIDACNAIMDKVAYPEGLISFTTENKLANGDTHLFRPRLIGYIVALFIMISVFAYTLMTRVPLELDVIRDRSLLYRETPRGLIENMYTLRINNMDNNAHTYALKIEAKECFRFIGERVITVAGGEVFTHLVRLELDPALLKRGNTDIIFVLTAQDNTKIHDSEESRFIGPFMR
ncbi:MAG: cytochrome c oxidase accessory protein CcoG [Porticoccaceae bacterium]|nr:cytochrome c oxidase accessory protein CcoG [Porticoccaceae bacterium]